MTDRPQRDIQIYHATAPAVGRSARARKTITVADQSFYIGLCGNLHPLYVDERHAASFAPQGRIVFELVVASLATNALAELAGPAHRVAAMDVRFPHPARVGATIAASAEITAQDGDDFIASICCRTHHDDVIVAEGSARLAPLPKRADV